MTHKEKAELIRRGLRELEQENTPTALKHFETAASLCPTAIVLSCMGYCLARERLEVEEGLTLCLEAIRLEPANPLHYLHLGKVYLLACQKQQAVEAFCMGLQFGFLPKLAEELDRIGRRRPPLIPFLDRNHPINRCGGLLLHRLRIRTPLDDAMSVFFDDRRFYHVPHNDYSDPAPSWLRRHDSGGHHDHDARSEHQRRRRSGRI